MFALNNLEKFCKDGSKLDEMTMYPERCCHLEDFLG
jgi:hypothetical protein